MGRGSGFGEEGKAGSVGGGSNERTAGRRASKPANATLSGDCEGMKVFWGAYGEQKIQKLSTTKGS